MPGLKPRPTWGARSKCDCPAMTRFELDRAYRDAGDLKHARSEFAQSRSI